MVARNGDRRGLRGLGRTRKNQPHEQSGQRREKQHAWTALVPAEHGTTAQHAESPEFAVVFETQFFNKPCLLVDRVGVWGLDRRFAAA